MSSSNENYPAPTIVDGTTQVEAKHYNKAVANMRFADVASRPHIALKRFKAVEDILSGGASRTFNGVGGMDEVGYAIPLETSVYDSDRFIDGSDNTILRVPPGFGLAQLQGEFEHDPTDDWGLQIVKNGTTIVGSEYINGSANDSAIFRVSTGVLPVNSGDYFTLNIVCIGSSSSFNLDDGVVLGISGTTVTYSSTAPRGYLCIQAWVRDDL
jgi:hypothetical protein